MGIIAQSKQHSSYLPAIQQRPTQQQQQQQPGISHSTSAVSALFPWFMLRMSGHMRTQLDEL